MRVLVIHNAYRIVGGEDTVCASEMELLQSRGNEVKLYTESSSGIEGSYPVNVAVRSIWNHEQYRRLQETVRQFRPDVAHVHNFYPLISPAAYHALHNAGVPVVQTLHNYRLLCLKGVLFRNGSICERCKGRCIAWPGVLRGCYRASRAISAAKASILGVHSLIGTWRNKVDVYIALSEFAQRTYVEAGVPAEKLMLKPNFIEDPGKGDGGGDYVACVGRLSEEKGIDVLLKAWPRLNGRIRVRVFGGGPMQQDVEKLSSQSTAVIYEGVRPLLEVIEALGSARALIFPSQCYENMPRTIIEAFAKGTPVISSKLGTMTTMIEHGRTGLHFAPGDVNGLVTQVNWMLDHPQVWQQMRQEARCEYEAKYTAERNYEMLMSIYREAIARRKRNVSQ